MLRLAKLALAATAIVGLSTVANAATFSYNGFNVIGGQAVGITSPVVKTVNAGEIELIGAGANTGQTLDAWCLDLFNALLTTDTYNIVPLAPGQGAGGSNPALSALQINEIGGLMLRGNSLSLDGQAAVQVAIWKIEYGAALSTTIGGSLLDNSANTLVTQFSLGGADFDGNAGIDLLVDAPAVPNQTLAVPTETPIPATLPLLGGGLGLFGWLVRKRRPRVSVPVMA
jgi:hypothetical protein